MRHAPSAAMHATCRLVCPNSPGRAATVAGHMPMCRYARSCPGSSMHRIASLRIVSHRLVPHHDTVPSSRPTSTNTFSIQTSLHAMRQGPWRQSQSQKPKPKSKPWPRCEIGWRPCNTDQPCRPTATTPAKHCRSARRRGRRRNSDPVRAPVPAPAPAPAPNPPELHSKVSVGGRRRRGRERGRERGRGRR